MINLKLMSIFVLMMVSAESTKPIGQRQDYIDLH